MNSKGKAEAASRDKTFLALRIAESRAPGGTRAASSLVVLALLFFTGCAVRNPGAPAGYLPEQYARDAIAAAKGFIEQAQEHHGDECRAECRLPTVRDRGTCVSICNAINRAVAAQNTAIDALNLYCAGPGWAEGGACNPTPDAEPRLREAVGELDRIIRDLGTLMKGAKP